MLPTKDPCHLIKGKAREFCERGDDGKGKLPNGDVTGTAASSVRELADKLISGIKALLAPKDGWTPKSVDGPVYSQFAWLGQHLAVSIMICVVVVCGLTAWQGVPRLRQMGLSVGWTLVAVAGTASVPAIVLALNKAVSATFLKVFDSDESTLFAVIRADMKTGADSSNPLAMLIIVSALVVALGFAFLVCVTRNPAIIGFVLVAPLVLASLARSGDTRGVRLWVVRLLGLLFAPLMLVLVVPLVSVVKGSLVLDAVLLLVADLAMLRMITHGVPYLGPRIAGVVRKEVESRTPSPLVRGAVRLGAPLYDEYESTPRGPRAVDTPGRGVSQDGGVVLGSYGIRRQSRPGRLTTASAADRVRRDAPRTERLAETRRRARADAQAANPAPGPRNRAPGAPAAPGSGAGPASGPASPGTPPPRTSPRTPPPPRTP
ncbi:hypothetical protein ACIBEA_41790 [Streptomyces sp. NPDC051555]|uniref:hypothetical protein n=1 Tax=Streptomyces sp. NPDC051555 TaxID=3365657 RepID=UPI003796E1C9